MGINSEKEASTIYREKEPSTREKESTDIFYRRLASTAGIYRRHLAGRRRHVPSAVEKEASIEWPYVRSIFDVRILMEASTKSGTVTVKIFTVSLPLICRISSSRLFWFYQKDRVQPH